jgi:cell division transport system permease protein
MAGVSAVKYVSQDDALDRFRRDLEGQAGILEGLSKNPLPASFEIQLREGGADSERVASVAEKVGELAGIDEVQYGQEWLSQYATAINLLRIAGVVIGTFLLIGCMLVVANTIKLAVYARREELEILSLVGATKRFIRLPFLIEGMAQGFLGALLAVVILYGGYRILLSRIDASLLLNVGRFELIFLSTPALLSLLGIGTIVGFCGSAISVRRFGRS